MGANHSHQHDVTNNNERALWWALSLTTIFLVAELAGGILTKSLALISDAAHMFTDTAALAVSLAALYIGKRPADSKRSYGYYRFEILAAAFNAILLFLVALYILVEAYQRLKNPEAIQSTSMLFIAIAGLIINLICMRILAKGKDNSLNLKGAYLEVWSDMLGSVGVIVGALLIRWTGWLWIDSVIAVAIGLWVLPRTTTLLKESINILLEGVPQGIGLNKIEQSILEISGVASLHDLHVWSISSGKTSLSVHVVNTSDSKPFETLEAIRTLLAKKYHITHSTVQVERMPCEQSKNTHVFQPSHDE